MATSLPGRLASVAVSTSGSSYTSVGNTRDSISWKITPETFDATTRDDASWKRQMVGRSSASFSFAGQYAEDDAGQDIIVAAATVPGTKLYFRLRMQTVTGADEYLCSGYVDYSIDPPNDGPIMFSCSVTVDGAITKQAQS